MKRSPLIAVRHLPLLIEPQRRDDACLEALLGWLRDGRTLVEALLRQHGALLLRGFALADAGAFERVSTVLSPTLKAYLGGDSPRRRVLGNIYTASEYPAGLEVRLHNELSYGAWWPSRVYFYCQRSAPQGGETHIADGREIYARIPAPVRRRFEHQGVRYHQHLPDAAKARGEKSWQQTFETERRREVEAHCRAAGMRWSWTRWGLRTSISRPAVLQHPQTGEKVWFNQADQWHAALAGVKHREDRSAGGEPLAHATFGDGSEIPEADLHTVRRVCGACEVVYPWREHDVLVLDNVLTMHGRKPYHGERRVLVAMA